MSQILWTRYFLDAQGYNINGCIVYQDNKSAILLEQNGRASSSKRTRHINIRYYFVTDHANCGEITIKHCPTVEMIGDFFTKPLQGGLFIKFRDRILNPQTDPSTVPIEDHRSVLGQDHSHATGQSRGESHMTAQSRDKQHDKHDRLLTTNTAPTTRTKHRINSLFLVNLVSVRVTATQFIRQEGRLTGHRCQTTRSVTSRLWLQQYSPCEFCTQTFDCQSFKMVIAIDK